MEDLKKAIARCEAKLFRLKEEALLLEKAHVAKEQAFQKKYDEVLNKHILGLFRKSGEELSRYHEHRTVKIINGEIVHLRLDFLHGQADGIKAVFDRDNIAMYIWFSPQANAEKIIFKMICRSKEINITEPYHLDKMNSTFLLDFIAEKSRLVS